KGERGGAAWGRLSRRAPRNLNSRKTRGEESREEKVDFWVVPKMTSVLARRTSLVLAVVMAASSAVSVGASSGAGASPAIGPPIRHVWFISLENTSYRESFGNPTSGNSYLTQVLPGQ